ncbi:lipopolysaccharide biosynthesis protein [Roseateles chitinivorans]|uniref:lipopolysaccharide biosynthesis protein n=1 Tax=Roseateles chitinivorans TaxID=2917965 RepID=UPI003D66CB43
MGAAALGASFLMPLTYTAQTVFIPPQQTQSAAASALASIGALAGLAGGGVKTPGDQYVSLLQSANVEDRLIDQFKLMDVYEVKYRFLARRKLEQSTRVQLGKKDGLITVEVDAGDPKMAADMANQYVTELRRLSAELALTEAQQRRVFFESELKHTKSRLVDAQQALQAGGFSPGAMKAEPKTAAETYARVKAELTAAEVKLQTLRQARADASAEVQQQLAATSALRAQLAKFEVKSDDAGDADYLGRYREFKYQEALFELYSKQFELARMDESRDGATIQVVDVATLPEYKSKPKRAFIAAGTGLLTFMLLAIGVLARHFWRQAKADPANADKFAQLSAALKN